mmetsp:Transcript_1131/g.1483  ORF Transcript_1131/g.1483 Transcript_1131/m.1483 type:complete len:232 (+) Transcript_1131:121-816(+)
MPGGPTINDKFPDIKGETQDTTEFSLYDYLGDSWGIVFMHPGDFTPVCTTELGTAALMAKDFEKRGVKLCGFSCNDSKSHKAWIEDIKTVTGGSVEFPLFCDPSRAVAAELGILDATNMDAKGLPLTVRSVFIIKPDKGIALMMTYPASTGRSFAEILRVVDSCQMTVKHAVATPVNWKNGEDVLVNFPLSNAQADERFGKDGYKIVEVPSEKGKDLARNYLRTTADPVAS